jgi:phasin family protein
MGTTDDVNKFANQAQDAARSAFSAFQGIAEAQSNILKRLSEVQHGMIRQLNETATEQMKLMSQVRDPKEFAKAQAELVKTQGQRYVDSVKQAVDITAEAWQQYADRFEQGVSAAADKARTASPGHTK